MDKKPYSPPTLTQHGEVVEQTKGAEVGINFEILGYRPREDD